MKRLFADAIFETQVQSVTAALDKENITLVEAGCKIPSHTDLTKSILVGKDLAPGQVIDFVLDKKIYQCIQLDSINFERELLASSQIIKDPNVFIMNPFDFLLSTNSSVQKKFEFNTVAQKSDFIKALRSFLDKTPHCKTIYDEALVVADELFTNAIFNAPAHEGQDRVDALQRISTLAYPPGLRAVFRMAHDGTNLILCCEDPCGSLKPDKVLNRIQKCFQQGVSESINMGFGGAGIGTYMVYNLGVSLYVNVKKNKMTQVCCIFPLKKSSKNKSLMSKNLHVHLFEGDK